MAEIFLFYGCVLGIAIVPDFGFGQGSLRLDRAFLLSLTMIYLPLIPFSKHRLSFEDLGLGRKGFLPSLGLAALAGAVCLSLFVLLWHWVGGPLLGLPPMGSGWGHMGAAQWAQAAAGQFLAVAIPEEWFFRGYLQGRMARIWPRVWGRGRASISLAAVLSAFLFALAHAARYHTPVALNVFFPGLLFAWSREQGGHLSGPVLLHAASNLLLFALAAPPA